MKKQILITLLSSLLATTGMAQKFLDIYRNGNIISSLAIGETDYGQYEGKNDERSINFYHDGEKSFHGLVSEVDSIKVFDQSKQPFVYLGIVGFNQDLYEKPFDVLATRTESQFEEFVNGLSRKDGTLLYHAVDHALDMLEKEAFVTPLTSVNLITFTDGLDQGSLMMNSSYGTDEQYLNAVSNRIKNTTVNGLPLTAYSLGLRGSDVSNYELFQRNLTRLASSQERAFEVNSMSAVQNRLQDISNQIISISNKQTISLKIPGQSNDTKIRFTFDGGSATTSDLYIEGTFNLSDRTLRNIIYHGLKAESGSTVQGKQDGIFVTFTFTGLQRRDGNGLIPTNNIRQYYQSANTTTWQRNSEFTPGNNTQTTITHSGSVIMLVLDCSSSLGSQFSNMQNYANKFISNVAHNAVYYRVRPSLAVATSSLYLIPKKSAIVKITSGCGNYSVKSSDTSVATASLSGSEIMIKGLKTGTSYINVWDKRAESGTSILVKVVDKFSVSNSPAYLTSGGSGSVWITSGSGSFSVSSSNTSVATVSLSEYKVNGESEIMIKGLKTGTSNVTVTDKLTLQTLSFLVKVVDDFSVSESSVYLTPEKSTTVVKITGSGSYDIYNSNPSVVTASLSGSTITLKALKTGDTRIEVTDKHLGLILRIYVHVEPNLTVSATSVDLMAGENSSIKVTSGSGGYSVSSSNSAVATASISGSVITVKGIKQGTTYVTVTDYNTNQTVKINVSVTDNLTLSNSSLIVKPNGTATAKITSGSGNYSVSSSNTSAVTVSLSGKTITVKGVKEGSAVITVKDNKSGQLAEITVIISHGVFYTVNGVTFSMMKVDGGTFMMGGLGPDSYRDEKPQHQVTLSDYYIGETEVTIELWEAVMGDNSFDSYPQRPVMISWNDCQTFIEKLNTLTGKKFRLPTEAEWEYAARGGKKSKGYEYSGSDNIDDVAWYHDNSDFRPHNVATKAPNELGIYDMSGNVWEWCQDCFDYYSYEAQINPTGPSSGHTRVIRGGCYESKKQCRVTYRTYYWPSYADGKIGLRLAL